MSNLRRKLRWGVEKNVGGGLGRFKVFFFRSVFLRSVSDASSSFISLQAVSMVPDKLGPKVQLTKLSQLKQISQVRTYPPTSLNVLVVKVFLKRQCLIIQLERDSWKWISGFPSAESKVSLFIWETLFISSSSALAGFLVQELFGNFLKILNGPLTLPPSPLPPQCTMETF